MPTETPTIDTIIAEIAALASKCAGAGIAYMGSPASESFAKVCDELREIQSALAAALPAPGEWNIWRNRWVSERTAWHSVRNPEWGYEMARAHAEEEANSYDTDFNEALERLRNPAAPLAAAQGEK